MSENTIFAFDKLSFSLPKDWQEQTDVANSNDMKEFAIKTPASSARLTVEPVEPSRAMPYGQDQKVIDIIHDRSIDDDSGLIEAATIENGGFNSVYSLFKRKVNSPSQPNLKLFYSASLFVHTPSGKAYAFQFLGQEEGATGVREAQILAQAQANGSVTITSDSESGKPTMKGWAQDPYDPNFSKGFLMNQSEKVEYDASFPQHPLSLLRSAVSVVSHNLKES